MSQTETLLLFVLGFFACLFVVLLFSRGIFSVLGKLSGWRAARKVPAAIRELQAERDGLKAEKAMMAQRLEASITDMKMRMAEQMAEVSRNRNRLLDMSQTLKERESTISHLQTQFDDKAAQVISLQSQIEENVKSINLAYAKMSTRDDEHLKMQQVLKDSQATLVSRDEKIRNLMDEVKALREFAANATENRESGKAIERPALALTASAPGSQSPLLVSSIPTMQSFEEPPANINGNNPLIYNPATDDIKYTARTDDVAEDNDTYSVDRSISNVLSLAERVRNLKTGMKKA
jgi:vacuolar-type H+-ATPase subunit I/STV1